MANDLLADFRAASNRFDHVLYNEQTQRFERAGKRHAIATFFGSANAISRNKATLAKISEAFGAEFKEGGRFFGSHETAERLFSGIAAGARIKSDAVNAIIDGFHRDAMADAGILQRRKEAVAGKMCDMIAENLSADPSLLADARAKDVLKAIALRHLDVALGDSDVGSAMSLLQAWSEGGVAWKDGGPVADAFADFAGFVVGVNVDSRLQNAFGALLERVAREKSPRFAQMVCLEMQSAAGPHCRSRQDAGTVDWTGAMAGRVERLLADIDDASSDFGILKNMETLPVDRESYSVALDVCGAVKNLPELENWLFRQPQDRRVTLAAAILDAMGQFGGSDDPVLLRKLMGAGEGIERLYSSGELTLESAYRAIEGSSARLPKVLEVDGSSVGKASDEVRYFFRDRAIGEFGGLFPRGPGVTDTVVGTRLIVRLGCSPAVAHWIAGNFSNVDLARLSDGQLKMLTTLTGAEMELLDRIAGFETALGTDADDLHAQIADTGSPLWRMMAYPELSADADVYAKARDLQKAFDVQFGELAKCDGLRNTNGATKWMLERFVFQDLAMRVAKGVPLPGAQTFAEGLTPENPFVRMMEGSSRRPHIAWTIANIAPEFRGPVISALGTYGIYDSLYLLTRLVSNKDKVCDLCSKAQETGIPLSKEDVFRAAMGEKAVFDPKAHESPRVWDDISDSEAKWVLEKQGLSDDDGVLYSRKFAMVSDFLQKYDIPKETVMDFAFQEDREGEIAFRHPEYAKDKIVVVVNALDKGVAAAEAQFGIDYNRAVPGRYAVKFSLPGGTACFRKSAVEADSFENAKEKEGIREAAIGICGVSHPKQAENLLMVLSQAFELDLYAPFVAYGFDPSNRSSGVSRNFEVSRNGRDGSVFVHITDTGASAVKYDWGITLFADGTHAVTDMRAWRNPACDGARL